MCNTATYTIFTSLSILRSRRTHFPNARFHRTLIRFLKLVYLLFMNFWLCQVFVGAHMVSLVAVSGAYSPVGSVQASLWRLL